MGRITVILCVLGFVGAAWGTSSQMVLTPAGYRNRAKFHVLKPGQSVRRRSGNYEIVDNETHQVVQRFAASSATAPPINDSGWMTYAGWQIPDTDTIQTFTSTWTVPAMPTNQGNQLLYLFNGLSDSANSVILQPVLQWGESPAGGGNYWAIASWYVTSSDQSFSTTPIEVDPGTVLTGTMAAIPDQSNASAGGYTSQFAGVAGTTLTVTEVPILKIAYETLEVYDVDSCGDYPKGSTAFTAIGLKTSSGATQLNWQPAAGDTATSCGLHATAVNNSATDGEVDLFYEK